MGCGCGGSTYGENAAANPTTDDDYTWNGPAAPPPPKPETKKPASK